MKKSILSFSLLCISIINTSDSSEYTFSAPKGMSKYHAFMILFNDIFTTYQSKIETPTEAAQIFEAFSFHGNCDYVLSRSMHISLNNMSKIHSCSYDRDHGKGRAEELLSKASPEEIAIFNKEIGNKSGCDFFTKEFIEKMSEPLQYYLKNKIEECSQKRNAHSENS